MEWLIVLGIGVVVVVVIAFLALRRQSGTNDSLDPWGTGSDPSGMTRPLPPTTTGMGAAPVESGSFGSLPEPLLLELRTLISAGRKIDAIKRLRAYTGWDLKTAKEYLDQLGNAPGASVSSTGGGDAMHWLEQLANGSRPANGSAPVDLLIQANSGIRPAVTSLSEEQLQAVIRLMVTSNKIATIKLVREYTGWGLKEAKDYVDALEPQVKSGVLAAAQGQALTSENEEVARRVLAMLGRASHRDIVTYLCEDYNWSRDRAEAYVVELESNQKDPPAVQGAAALTPEVLSTVRNLVQNGKKIEAIKVVRQATSWGLKEAKDYVEALRF